MVKLVDVVWWLCEVWLWCDVGVMLVEFCYNIGFYVLENGCLLVDLLDVLVVVWLVEVDCLVLVGYLMGGFVVCSVCYCVVVCGDVWVYGVCYVVLLGMLYMGALFEEVVYVVVVGFVVLLEMCLFVGFLCRCSVGICDLCCGLFVDEDW